MKKGIFYKQTMDGLPNKTRYQNNRRDCFNVLKSSPAAPANFNADFN